MDNKSYIVGKSVLTIPDYKVNIKPVKFEATDDSGNKFQAISYSFGTAASIQRNDFNKRICYNLSRIGAIMYHYIAFNLKYNYNIISLDCHSIHLETGLSIRNVSRAIDELLEFKVIYKTLSQGIYVVNPKCITNCNAAEFERRYLSVERECDVCIGSKNELIYSYKYENISQ